MTNSTLSARCEWLCRCLRVTEQQLYEACLEGHGESLEDVLSKTGAGQGCSACHRRIRQALESFQQPAVL